MLTACLLLTLSLRVDLSRGGLCNLYPVDTGHCLSYENKLNLMGTKL